MPQTDRVLDLEGVHNFRDFGGYRAASGTVRRGLLWRSGQHAGATDSDVGRIDALALADVFDLRSSRERTLHPCRRPEGFAARIHHSPDRSEALAPHVAAAQADRSSAERSRAMMIRTYESIAFRPELVAMMRAYLAALSRGEGASLVNCLAGKDRTGITVAMAQAALGVHRDDMFEDYLLTNSAGDVEARIAAGSASIRKMMPDIPDEALRVIMGVEADYLATALAAIEERHGSLDAYLESELGMDADAREALQAALVE